MHAFTLNIVFIFLYVCFLFVNDKSDALFVLGKKENCATLNF